MNQLSEKQLCMVADIVSQYTDTFTITQTDAGLQIVAKGWNVEVKPIVPYRLLALATLGMLAALMFETLLRIRLA